MTLYIIYIVMTLLLSFLFDGKEDSRAKKVWYILTGLFLILLSGFRNGVGGDTQCYMVDFDYVPTLAYEYREYIEENIIRNNYMPGWSILNIFCKKTFDSFYAVQLIEAMIVNGCVLYLFHQYTRRIFLCALLFGLTGYFFIYNTEVMREAIAISLVSVGMYKYLNGNKLFFYLSILLGLTFHVSAAVVIIFPFMRILKHISINTLLIAFIVSFGLWVFSNVLLFYVAGHLFGDSAIVSKIFSYGDMNNNIFGFLESALRYLVATASIMYFAQFSPYKTDRMEVHYPVYVGFFLLLAMMVCAIPGLYRLLNYTAIFTIILVAEYMGSVKSQLTSLPFYKSIILLIFFFYCGKYYFKEWPESRQPNYAFFVPYTSILDENPNTDFRFYMWQNAVQRNKTQENSRGL